MPCYAIVDAALVAIPTGIPVTLTVAIAGAFTRTVASMAMLFCVVLIYVIIYYCRYELVVLLLLELSMRLQDSQSWQPLQQVASFRQKSEAAEILVRAPSACW